MFSSGSPHQTCASSGGQESPAPSRRARFSSRANSSFASASRPSEAAPIVASASPAVLSSLRAVCTETASSVSRSLSPGKVSPSPSFGSSGTRCDSV